MEVTIKARFNASKERIESFGNNRYVMYLPFSEDEDSLDIIRELLSRYVGAPLKAVQFKTQNSVTKDFVFYVN